MVLYSVDAQWVEVSHGKSIPGVTAVTRGPKPAKTWG